LEEVFPNAIAKGPDIKVSEWWYAAAPMSTFTFGIQLVLNISLAIIFVVSIIIIMNTLIISVMERTKEIGTIRALGGKKSFIFKLFIAETCIVSVLFGFLGLVIGTGIIFLLQLVGIPAEAISFLGTLTTSNVLYPSLSFWTILYSLLFIGIVGILSSLYPVYYAVKISPIKALQEE
jgi:putative ABC transport system permease protein